MDDVTKLLRHKIAMRRALDTEIDQLIVQARAQDRPADYAELEEITGFSREWLRRIVNGTAPPRRPRRQPKTDA